MDCALLVELAVDEVQRGGFNYALLLEIHFRFSGSDQGTGSFEWMCGDSLAYSLNHQINHRRVILYRNRKHHVGEEVLLLTPEAV